MMLNGEGTIMSKKAVIYYPKDEQVLAQIYKEIVAFRCAAVIRYVESLNLNSPEIELLYASIVKDVTAKKAIDSDKH